MLTRSALSNEKEIFSSVKAKLGHMGSASRKVAQVVLENPAEVIHLSITEMAEKAGVSEATVVRFSQDLGFKGYQDFKIHLSLALVRPLKSLDVQIESGDSPKTVMEKVCQTIIQTIYDTLEVIDEDALARAIEVLAKARRIQLFGCGRSGIMAKDAENRFLKLGLWARAFSDSHNAAQACSTLGREDAIVIISYSGTTKEVLKVAEIARSNGVTIIAITRYAKTPLSRLADINLWTSSPESHFRSDGVSSRFAQLCIIDAIYAGLFVRFSDRFDEAVQKATSALADFRL
jgi:RpiR family carbohydrate utilization transcriptional regulator